MAQFVVSVGSSWPREAPWMGDSRQHVAQPRDADGGSCRGRRLLALGIAVRARGGSPPVPDNSSDKIDVWDATP